ncbi:MAG: hypothetical protein WKF47_04355 [Geodermatophilaceae bacterium]
MTAASHPATSSETADDILPEAPVELDQIDVEPSTATPESRGSSPPVTATWPIGRR